MGQVPYEANAHGSVYTYTPNNCIYLPKSRKTFIVKNYGVDLSYLIVSLQGRRRLCFVGYVTVYVVDVVEIRGWSCLGMVALWFVWCGDLTRQPPLSLLLLCTSTSWSSFVWLSLLSLCLELVWPTTRRVCVLTRIYTVTLEDSKQS